jgi:hypothetical protein
LSQRYRKVATRDFNAFYWGSGSERGLRFFTIAFTREIKRGRCPLYRGDGLRGKRWVSPALLADTSERSWQHLFHSLGFTPTEQKNFTAVNCDW